ncbi:MAG: hypothetical protein ACOYXO_15580, partial [Chloroflexota bacterium]
MAVITRKGLKLAAKKVAFLPVRVMLFGLEVLLVTGALFGLAFIVRTVWTIAYIASGQYALDKRLDQWIRS